MVGWKDWSDSSMISFRPAGNWGIVEKGNLREKTRFVDNIGVPVRSGRIKMYNGGGRKQGSLLKGSPNVGILNAVPEGTKLGDVSLEIYLGRFKFSAKATGPPIIRGETGLVTLSIYLEDKASGEKGTLKIPGIWVPVTCKVLRNNFPGSQETPDVPDDPAVSGICPVVLIQMAHGSVSGTESHWVSYTPDATGETCSAGVTEPESKSVKESMGSRGIGKDAFEKLRLECGVNVRDMIVRKAIGKQGLEPVQMTVSLGTVEKGTVSARLWPRMSFISPDRLAARAKKGYDSLVGAFGAMNLVSIINDPGTWPLAQIMEATTALDTLIESGACDDVADPVCKDAIDTAAKAATEAYGTLTGTTEQAMIEATVNAVRKAVASTAINSIHYVPVTVEYPLGGKIYIWKGYAERNGYEENFAFAIGDSDKRNIKLNNLENPWTWKFVQETWPDSVKVGCGEYKGEEQDIFQLAKMSTGMDKRWAPNHRWHFGTYYRLASYANPSTVPDSHPYIQEHWCEFIEIDDAIFHDGYRKPDGASDSQTVGQDKLMRKFNFGTDYDPSVPDTVVMAAPPGQGDSQAVVVLPGSQLTVAELVSADNKNKGMSYWVESKFDGQLKDRFACFGRLAICEDGVTVVRWSKSGPLCQKHTPDRRQDDTCPDNLKP